MSNKILELIRSSNEPLCVQEICEELGISIATAKKELGKLISSNKIKEISSKSRKYFISQGEGMTAAEMDNAKTIIMERIAYSKGDYEELHAKVKDINGKIEGFYINIISIMGVFVAIFALISNNAKFVYDITNTGLSLKDMCMPIIISNLVLVVSICILLICIRMFIGRKK